MHEDPGDCPIRESASLSPRAGTHLLPSSAWQLAQKVVSRHGATRPELPRIQRLVKNLGEDLAAHLDAKNPSCFPMSSAWNAISLIVALVR
jgi:iron-sulfur cluster repair protein YtfE (RIC family)